MIDQRVKAFASYTLIVLAGLGCGYGLSLLPSMLKPAYAEGNYAAYFPDTQTKAVLYGTDWCAYCAKTRAYFKQRNIAYIDLDIEKSPEAKRQHLQLGGGGVPAVLIGKRRIQGFDAAALDAALEAAAR
ncbi:glutaredoxin family protein [Janthinobacterium fluminis]|uniref:Glutaredoxin family protein n=1 Tax=Janthinobacterium fluminis TaxID=2987524 RepID=A0ABT5K428_9BURK|nr:glutaredoxin family protein [Janthinobacterium fluminis]MDC8759758.1 glutaredoxin family protein [Janthinobacterium fluminis]